MCIYHNRSRRRHSHPTSSIILNHIHIYPTTIQQVDAAGGGTRAATTIRHVAVKVREVLQAYTCIHVYTHNMYIYATPHTHTLPPQQPNTTTNPGAGQLPGAEERTGGRHRRALPGRPRHGLHAGIDRYI